MEKIDNKIRAIVDDIDPNKQLLEVKVILPTQFNYIRIYLKKKTSEMDIKIFIKTEFGGIFDKGNGINLLINHLKCDITEGTILVCGDSNTDIPMLEYCLKQNPKVFTKDFK